MASVTKIDRWKFDLVIDRLKKGGEVPNEMAIREAF
jgi:hypothetical protein